MLDMLPIIISIQNLKFGLNMLKFYSDKINYKINFDNQD